MATIDSILLSQFILAKVGPMCHLKLQKLLYFSQGWHLACFGDILINDDFEAWLHGPVSRKVWDVYKEKSILFKDIEISDQLKKDALDSVAAVISQDQSELLNDVLTEYGKQTAFYLERMTHSEPPWLESRRGVTDGEPSNKTIPKSNIKAYFESLLEPDA